ncbi:Chitotriosidase-1 [Lachnellula suecica]|uniref:chitinase n=1 Tax=Lachnellula suecica TaxID=602035 RepID=A0A8T9BW87_9HELO|nr:Chitotriosidase-1 [Lachnellula suecica]
MFPSVILFIWTFFVLHSVTSHAQLVPYPSTNTTTRNGVCQQNLEQHPPLPVLDIGLDHMLGQMGANATAAENVSIAVENNLPIPAFNRFTVPNQKNAPAQCGPSQACADGSCCNSVSGAEMAEKDSADPEQEGKCGYKAYNCNSTAATSCISNCDAHAMCGVDSLYGQQKCGLNLCCSYLGYCGKGQTTDAHCTNAAPMACQEGFGTCGAVKVPSCPDGKATASKGRKVAYYQGQNIHRPCGKVYPSQIDTSGLSHLNFAFATIDPASFAVIPSDPNEILLYHQFTSLKSRRPPLETWISINGPTTRWSDMCLSSSTRASFISSLIDFMKKWGFQGADLDWEYPAQDGGRKEDTANVALLLKEMRDAFGDKFGISIALPNDFSYLAAWNPSALQSYVTFFNFMAYDLHGPWEEKRLGAELRPQASLLDIEKTILPAWFDDLDPAKINLGLPYYSRGYTVSNTNCMDIGCPYSGLSLPGPCTKEAGIHSLAEIQAIIAERHLTPKFIPEILQKVITFDDQWIPYDDCDTIEGKLKYADEHCLGGSMIWSIDLANVVASRSLENLQLTDGSPEPPLMTISTDGTCGKGKSCFGSPFGDCCSSNGWCGSKVDYCSARKGCQDAFGVCAEDHKGFNPPSSTVTGSPAPSATAPSTDGHCGNGKGCERSIWGDCCSQYGFCGSTPDYCSKEKGCQKAFGLCEGDKPSSSTSSVPVSKPTPLLVSADATCGNGKTCKGSEHGNCCSKHGWCGSTADYCSEDKECQGDFGLCGDNLKMSVDGSCKSGVFCQGSPWGNCCSSHGWCGSTDDYCGDGCQSALGSCS